MSWLPRLDGADPINRGLTFWAPAKEPSGQLVTDISPYRRNATTTASPARVVSRRGRTVELNGSSQFLTSTSAAPSVGKLTISAWVMSNFSTGSRQSIFTASVSGTTPPWNGVLLTLTSAGTALDFWPNTAAANVTSDTFSTSYGNVVHFVVTYDNVDKVARFYRNGVPVGAPGSAETMQTGLARDDWGRYGESAGSPWWLSGTIGNMRKWNRVLSPAEISRLYRDPWAGATRRPDPPLYIASANVSVSVTGAASTVSAGTLSPASTVAVTGSASTLSAGTVVPALGVAAAGSAITSSAGTVTPGLTASLSGSAATASAGTLGYSAALAFTGSAITSAAGTVIAGLGVAISGAAITSARGSVGYSASISLSGASMSASGGTLGASGGTMPVNVSLRGELVRVVPGNIRVRGGTRWVEPTPQAVALPSTIDNTLPPPPRLTGDAQSDLRAQQQWLATVYDQMVKRLNMLGRIVDHEDRLNRLENPDTTN